MISERYNIPALATTSVLLLGAVGCSSAEEEPPVYDIGETGRVTVAQNTVQTFLTTDGRYTTQELKAGNECTIRRGARVKVVGEMAMYLRAGAIGVECPDGAIIYYSLEEAERQDVAFADWVEDRDRILSDIKNLKTNEEPKQQADRLWVEVVNAGPVKQKHQKGEKTLRYGDICLLAGQVQSMGTLSKGETLFRVENPGQLGDDCPTGTLFLESDEQDQQIEVNTDN